MKQTKYTRYHRYDTFGNKYIKRFELNETPVDIPDEGYTIWSRGTGPHSPEAYEKVVSGIRRACLGVPKTPEQKEKMRLAKLGVPKSEEHKLNMRKSYQKRHREIHNN